jgi:hypothetical protein
VTGRAFLLLTSYLEDVNRPAPAIGKAAEMLITNYYSNPLSAGTCPSRAVGE